MINTDNISLTRRRYKPENNHDSLTILQTFIKMKTSQYTYYIPCQPYQLRLQILLYIYIYRYYKQHFARRHHSNIDDLLIKEYQIQTLSVWFLAHMGSSDLNRSYFVRRRSCVNLWLKAYTSYSIHQTMMKLRMHDHLSNTIITCIRKRN